MFVRYLRTKRILKFVNIIIEIFLENVVTSTRKSLITLLAYLAYLFF